MTVRLSRILPKKAFILRQLKRPEEVYTLRSVYGDGFHLVGLYCPRDERERHLKLQYGMSDHEIHTLIGRDEEEPGQLGQYVRETFHLSDVFFRINADAGGIDETVARWIDLLFNLSIHSPTFDEFGMFQAYSASHRSAQLSRQVGASILTNRGDVLAVGTNEIPRAGGGQYWEGDRNDNRDHVRKIDSNDEVKREILLEVLVATVKDWEKLGPAEQTVLFDETKRRLKGSRLMNLTEFVRAVHAEMDAILSAGRNGISVRRATLYCTTFPCHNCARHIVTAGIKRVVYVEPYPKSMSPRLHNDSISVDRREPNPGTALEDAALLHVWAGEKGGGQIASEDTKGVVMDQRLTRNYSDPESRRWWESAEKAGANPPQIVVPPANTELRSEPQRSTAETTSAADVRCDGNEKAK